VLAYRIDWEANMLLKSLGLLAVVSVAICLVPTGAHFFELANKMAMSAPEYMTVQDLCGMVLFRHRGCRGAPAHLAKPLCGLLPRQTLRM
jgi:hypothetical protein